jgi:hypothetical protein
MSNLVLNQGDDQVLDVAVTDPPNNSATNLAGCKLWFYVKALPSDSDIEAVIAKSSPSNGITIGQPATLGTATIAIDGADTASLPSAVLGRNLVWALQIRDGSMAGKITTLATGTLIINRDLIQATS